MDTVRMSPKVIRPVTARYAARASTPTWNAPSTTALPAPKNDMAMWCRSSLDRFCSAAFATRFSSWAWALATRT